MERVVSFQSITLKWWSHFRIPVMICIILKVLFTHMFLYRIVITFLPHLTPHNYVSTFCSIRACIYINIYIYI